MKILLLGEYSNVHATLAEGLRTLGHQVTVASNGDFWKDYPRDIDLTRHEGPLGGLRLSAKVLSCLPRWRGYDVVQLINPMFLEMKAERILPIFKYLRRHNRKVVLCAMGMDYYWVSECTNYKPLRYSDFNIGDQLRTDECAVREQRDWETWSAAVASTNAKPNGLVVCFSNAGDPDSIVLRHSYGAVFRNCKFECTDGVLFIAESGDGIILADCDINGCKAFRFSRTPGQSDRNYVTDVRLDGEEYSVPDDQETITEIDGLELGERVTGGLSGPLIMMMSADRNTLKRGESTELRVRGLEQGMFVGWRSSESDVRIVVEGDGYSCRVYAPDSIGKQENVIISAYTEYGLEAACQLQLMPDTQSVNVRKKRKG